MISPINPYTIAPASARRVSVTFTADRSGDGWAVYQNTSWKDRDGDWDGDCTGLVEGLSETEATLIAARLTNGDLSALGRRVVAERAARVERRAAA